MKAEMRQKLAELPYEDKIRKVAQLIKLSATVKAARVHEEQVKPHSSQTRAHISGASVESKL